MLFNGDLRWAISCQATIALHATLTKRRSSYVTSESLARGDFAVEAENWLQIAAAQNG